MLAKFSKYEPLNSGNSEQARVLIHSGLTKKYDVNVDVIGVNNTVVEAGLTTDTTIKLSLVGGIHIPGTNEINAYPEYVDPRIDKHLALPDDEEKAPYQSIMSNLIRQAVKIGDARNNRGRFLREKTIYRPAIFLGSAVLGLITEGGTDLETGKDIADDRLHEIERNLFLNHMHDIQLVER
jgi:hypothetical protein